MRSVAYGDKKIVARYVRAILMAVMVNQQLLEYVLSQHKLLVSSDAIKKALATQGWTAQDIQEAFAATEKPPTPPAQPLPPPSTPATTPAPAVVSAHHIIQPRLLFWVIGVCVVAAVLGGVAYAYTQKLGPFARVPYSESNLLSGLLASSAGINSSSYALSGALTVGPRDADAKPFTVQVSNEAQLRDQYQNDSTRVKDITALLYALQDERGTYPSTLAKVAANASARNAYYKTSLSLKDPATQQQYGYVATDGGADFALTVVFDTKDAVYAVRKGYGFSATTTKIDGQTVTFTKDNPSYFYVSSEPPKPYLIQLGELVRLMPSEVAVSLSVAATTDWTKKDADWKFNADATADFGDLNFKINADALKKDIDYYFRINNIPSILGEALASIKGQWVKIDPEAASTTVSGYNEYIDIASQLPEAEKKYKENRAEFVDFLKKAVGFADGEHLVVFKNNPHSETVDGRLLYRFDLQINKTAMVPFYKKMVEEANMHKNTIYSDLFNDPGMVDYLQSDEFSQMFDYYDKNTTLTLWVDPQGYPAIVQYDIRVVPPDTATQLAQKQVNVTWKLVFSDINKPANIEAPKDAKPIEDLIKQADANNNYSLGDARTKGRDARRVSDIKQIQLGLELYYSDHSTYPGSLSILSPKYISSVPTDPSTSASYQYAALGSTSCTSYHLGAALEETNSALSQDEDAVPAKVCSASTNQDFNGKAPLCKGTTTTTSDLCFDVTP